MSPNLKPPDLITASFAEAMKTLCLAKPYVIINMVGEYRFFIVSASEPYFSQ